MSKNKGYVLDASALLALLQNESGADQVAATLPAAIVNTVNFSEVLAKLLQAGMPVVAAIQALDSLGLTVIDFNRPMAESAARLRPATAKQGLSLGDRACLATALAFGFTAVTADRHWQSMDQIPITLIR